MWKMHFACITREARSLTFSSFFPSWICVVLPVVHLCDILLQLKLYSSSKRGVIHNRRLSRFEYGQPYPWATSATGNHIRKRPAHQRFIVFRLVSRYSKNRGKSNIAGIVICTRSLLYQKL